MLRACNCICQAALIIGISSCASARSERRQAPEVSSVAADPLALRLRASAAGVLAESQQRAVGVVTANGQEVHYAWQSASPRALDADTMFEIGSVSKVFAALLLADAEQRGELALDDTIEAYLPGWSLPAYAGQPLTFRHALTHTLGIPDMMPSNWVPTDLEHGISRYSENMFRAYLAQSRSTSQPGARYTYSNIGSALIARALVTRTGKAYPALLQERVFAPLGMSRSGYADSAPEAGAELLDGYEEDETPSAPRIDVSPLGPCCVIRSTLRDMGRFIAAAVDEHNVLAPAFALLAQMQPEVITSRRDGRGVALGWDVDVQRNLLRKDGQVSGYRCDLLVSRAKRRGFYVIVNSQRTDITALANALQRALWP